MCAYCVLTASHSSVWGAQRPVGALEKKCHRKRTGAAPWPCGSRALRLHGSLGVVRCDWTGSSKRACRQGAAVGEIVFEGYSRPKKRLTLPSQPAGHVSRQLLLVFILHPPLQGQIPQSWILLGHSGTDLLPVLCEGHRVLRVLLPISRVVINGPWEASIT